MHIVDKLGFFLAGSLSGVAVNCGLRNPFGYYNKSRRVRVLFLVATVPSLTPYLTHLLR